MVRLSFPSPFPSAGPVERIWARPRNFIKVETSFTKHGVEIAVSMTTTNIPSPDVNLSQNLVLQEILGKITRFSSYNFKCQDSYLWLKVSAQAPPPRHLPVAKLSFHRKNSFRRYGKFRNLNSNFNRSVKNT